MDKEIVVIREFIDFAKSISKSDKGIKTLHRLVTADLNALQITQLKQAFSSFFGGYQGEWKNFEKSHLILYKTGAVSLQALEKACSKSDEDKTAFDEYMSVFRKLYADVRRNLIEFMTKLKLEEGSAEAVFMTNLFTEIGGDLIDTIKSGGGAKDIATLLPKIMEMLKSGKLLQAFDKLKDGSVKISKIIRAVLVLVEEYENQGTMMVENSATVSDMDSEQVVSTIVEEE